MSRLWPRNRFISSRSSVITLIKSSSNWFIRDSMRIGSRHAQTFLHDGTRGGVLQELALLGEQVMLDGECGERRFVKAAQDELFLAGIMVDVADGEDAGGAGLEFLGIHLERAFFQIQAPFRDGAQLRMQPVEREYLIGGQLQVPSVGRAYVEPREFAVVAAQAGGV